MPTTQKRNHNAMPSEKKELENIIVDVMKTIYDPEIPVDIFELGLIYEVKIDDDANAKIMTIALQTFVPAR